MHFEAKYPSYKVQQSFKVLAISLLLNSRPWRLFQKGSGTFTAHLRVRHRFAPLLLMKESSC